MKIKGSEITISEEKWNTYFEPNAILKKLGLDENMEKVADFGCGYGTFTIPAARLIHGTVYAIDSDTKMIAATQNKAGDEKVTNVKTLTWDLMSKEQSRLTGGTFDYVMLFNILHNRDVAIKLLTEAERILKPDGKIGIIHWTEDSTIPGGPPKSKQCIEWAKRSGFKLIQKHLLPPRHYGIVMKKMG